MGNRGLKGVAGWRESRLWVLGMGKELGEGMCLFDLFLEISFVCLFVQRSDKCVWLMHLLRKDWSREKKLQVPNLKFWREFFNQFRKLKGLLEMLMMRICFWIFFIHLWDIWICRIGQEAHNTNLYKRVNIIDTAGIKKPNVNYCWRIPTL